MSAPNGSGGRLSETARLRVSALVVAAVALVATAVTAKEQIPSGLIQAYKKEYAFLEAEKKALEKRITQFDKKSDRELKKAKGDVSGLQGKLLRLRTRSDDLEMDLMDAENSVIKAEEDTDLLDETMSRARETLENRGYDLPGLTPIVQEKPEAGDEEPADEAEGEENLVAEGEEGQDVEEAEPEPEAPGIPEYDPEDQKKLIVAIFESSVELMHRNGSVRSEQGAFFLPDGSKTEGTLIRVGEVATYGLGDDAQGALAPAGANRLKLWPVDASRSAKMIRDGKHPSPMGIFLYETLEKPVEEEQEKTVLSVIQAGKIIGWVIVVLGAFGVLLAAFRAVVLSLAGFGGRGLPDRVVKLVRDGRAQEAEAECKKSRSPMGRILGTTVRHLDRERDQIEDVVSEGILNESPAIERFSGVILVIAAVAPLLGLLGTVTGIISTFEIITEHGTGDPKLLSSGISEALVTTELGLIVAIPTLLMGTLLNGRAQALLMQLEGAALAVVNAARNPQGGAPGDDEHREAPVPAMPEPEPGPAGGGGAA